MNPFKPTLSRAWQGVHGAKLAGFLVLLYTLITWGLLHLFTPTQAQLAHPSLPHHNPLVILLLSLLIYSLGLQAGARIGLARSQNEPISFKHLFCPTWQTLHIFLATVMLIAIALLVGCFGFFASSLLVIAFFKPLIALRGALIITTLLGIVIFLLVLPIFMLIPFAIQNQDAKFYNAWLYVLCTVKTYRPSIIGYVLLTGIFNVLGALCLVVGLLWSQPLGVTLLGVLYRNAQSAQAQRNSAPIDSH